MTNRIRRGSVIVALGAGAALAATPTGATAAEGQWRCQATPISGTLLGQQLPTPAASNITRDCVAASTIPTLGLPAPLDQLLKLDLLNGVTTVADESATAASGLANVQVGKLPIPLPELPIPENIAVIDIPQLGAKVDLRPALAALKQLPSRDLLAAKALYSNVAGECKNGQPVVSGDARILGASVLGLEVDPNRVVDSAVNLVDTTNIALSNLNLDLANVTILGNTVTLGASPLADALKGILAALPPIQIPAQVARVKLTPTTKEVVDGVTTARALRAEVSLGGVSIADLRIGESSVGFKGNPCKPVGAARDVALECTKRKLALIDVLPTQKGRRVRLFGAADKSLVGRTVKIRFLASGKDVAKARVGKDGQFTTTAPMPARSIRATNRARYLARVGREKSLNLKLARRMVVQSVKSKRGRVTIKGRVIRPLANPNAQITLKRRVTCKKLETVKSFKPRKDGAFTVTVKSPANLAATVYRLQTRVRKVVTNPKTYPTFTLPRAVDL